MRLGGRKRGKEGGGEEGREVGEERGGEAGMEGGKVTLKCYRKRRGYSFFFLSTCILGSKWHHYL